MIPTNELIALLTFWAMTAMPNRADLLSAGFTIREIDSACNAIETNTEPYQVFCHLRQQSKEGIYEAP